MSRRNWSFGWRTRSFASNAGFRLVLRRRISMSDEKGLSLPLRAKGPLISITAMGSVLLTTVVVARLLAHAPARSYVAATMAAWRNPNGPQEFYVPERHGPDGAPVRRFRRQRFLGIPVVGDMTGLYLPAFDGPDSDPRGPWGVSGRRFWGADGHPLWPIGVAPYQSP